MTAISSSAHATAVKNNSNTANNFFILPSAIILYS
jgi:hypothetical protein